MVNLHIPRELVVQFDLYQFPPGEDIFSTYKKLHEGPAIVWTNSNGGHWIATRAQEIHAVLSNHLKFSSWNVFLPVNHSRPRMVPMELDPPEHRPYRRILDTLLDPEIVQTWESGIRSQAQSLVASLHTHGSCEFMEDFARKLPVNFLLDVFGILNDREKLMELVSSSVRPGKVNDVQYKINEMIIYLMKLIRDRREKPGDDLLSRCLSLEVSSGVKLDDEKALTIFWSLIGGSLDTTTASFGWVAHFLATHPGHLKQLRENPALIEKSVDEFFRRFSVSNPSRLVRDDIEFSGVKLKAGDPILAPGILYNLDEGMFSNPMEVDFNRENSFHNATFSLGAHTCPARTLARIQMKIFLEEWIRLIPEFEITGAVETRAGLVPSITSLPLRWKK